MSEMIPHADSKRKANQVTHLTHTSAFQQKINFKRWQSVLVSMIPLYFHKINSSVCATWIISVISLVFLLQNLLKLEMS